MRKFKIAAGLFAAVLASALVAAPVLANEPAQPVIVDFGGSINVSGSGAVSVAPEFATVRLGVTTVNEQPAAALLENNRAMDAVITAVRAFGVAEDDIATANFSIHEVRDWQDWHEIVGHSVNNNVTVTVRNIDQVGEIIGAAVAAGANMSGGVTFGISDSSVAYNQALALAVQNARSKANALASALGVSITGVAHVNENFGFHMPVARAEMAMATPAMMDMGWGVPIEAGDLTVTANIHVTFNISN